MTYWPIGPQSPKVLRITRCWAGCPMTTSFGGLPQHKATWGTGGKKMLPYGMTPCASLLWAEMLTILSNPSQSMSRSPRSGVKVSNVEQAPSQAILSKCLKGRKKWRSSVCYPFSYREKCTRENCKFLHVLWLWRRSSASIMPPERQLVFLIPSPILLFCSIIMHASCIITIMHFEVSIRRWQG